ncbi:hypothetical protein BH09PAT4_BH09PAT4_02930 [soil metagenome]
MKHESPSANSQQLPEEAINALGHIIRVGAAPEGHEDFNPAIEVFRVEGEGDRAQVYQMWAIDKFASNPVAYDAVNKFNLAGKVEGKEGWTQLLEHISGVAAIADSLENLLEKHGASRVEKSAIEAAALFDNIEKPLAVEAGIRMRDEAPLETAVLVHDIEKPAELAAAKEMAKGGAAGGYENNRDNPVLREGRLWSYLYQQGVEDDVILAAQNTGRGDRFFSELEDYSGDAVKKAIEDRESLARLMDVDRDVVDAMSPNERRRASIEAKGELAALVGIADAMAAQFKFQGMSEASIDKMAGYYKGRKTDPESQHFFGQDWPEYYKQVRQYLIEQVPQANRAAFVEDLDHLTHTQIFNETVLPEVLGESTMKRASAQADSDSVYELLRYPEASMHNIQAWAEAKAGDPERNEDVSFANESVVVLADGATDKTGFEYPSGKSGGRSLAEIAARVASTSESIGYDLADEVTAAVQEFYEENNPEALTDPSKRAASTLVVARVKGHELIVTQIGDTNVRLTMKDGSERIFTNDKLIDTENAQLRANHIKSQLAEFVESEGREPNDEEKAAIVASGRGAILDRLKTQYTLQNNAVDSQYGYGTIDGTTIPREFTSGEATNYVKTYVFPVHDVKAVELVSDGFYGEFPEPNSSAEEYARLYRQIHESDPDKNLRYLSTKPLDDATVIIAQLG